MAVKGNILIVDDNDARAEEMAVFLRESGYATQIVTDVTNKQAYSISGDSELDVILCELGLQGFSWVEARHALREMDVQVPAIMFCDSADVDTMMTALRLGASDFFLRPVEDRGALLRSIDRCVRLRRLRRELQESRRRLEAANAELRGTVKMLEQDQQAGRQVQLRMLPSSPMEIDGYVFSHRVIPSLYLSGDFTDYFTVGRDHVIFFMADVSGHGSSSAFATVLLKNLFARKRSDLLRRNDDSIMHPAAMLMRANKELLDLGVGKFATMLVGLLDMRHNHLRYAVAGHLPLPVLLTSEGARYLPGEGSAVGLSADAEFREHELDLPDSFLLALFSDGILETLPADNLLEREAYFIREFGKAAPTQADVEQRFGLDRVEAAPDDIAGLFVVKRG